MSQAEWKRRGVADFAYQKVFQAATSLTASTKGTLVGGAITAIAPSAWAALSATGKFKIVINGAVKDGVNPNFTGVTGMAGVATAINNALSAASAGVTCTYSSTTKKTDNHKFYLRNS